MAGDNETGERENNRAVFAPGREGEWSAEQIALMMVPATPYSVALGFRYVSSSPGRGSILLPWREDLVGAAGSGILAPGAVTALIDQTCGLAIMAYVGNLAQPATLDLRIDHLRPARPGASVTAAAHCYKATRTIAFLRSEAWDDSPDDPVATAQAAFTLNRREGA
ncbi:MAG TPA: PaaI family thioesterase [Hyphomonadaceae bacterium]|nr:PaaI family thioesterase [Hyphomonadaceae bacterium]